MGPFNKNLWAPWRMEYLQSMERPGGDECFLCRYWASPEQDRDNLVVWRGPGAMAVLNRFPYTSGHVLIAPRVHTAELSGLSARQLAEIMCLTRDMQTLLSRAIQPQGFNVGMNFGHCAGAGLPDHLHIHLVPRWEGDTNFMSVLGQVRVIPQALKDLYELLRRVSAEMGLPKCEPLT